MSVVSLEARLRKIEARRIEADPALRAMPDDELAQALREASNDPADHAFADWFEGGGEGPLPSGAFDAIQRSL
ncbi:hypothetical protein MKK63_24355 [Methylobacterium sp. J-088]|jgi:hypothetical protein|uniref:hypothetical protein n=1 Tax=Methylobacterium sp. J-088 TaxID=2836664 RepID=UPI001FBB5EAB|nr:hypothetical protein [Methylobacterium sp. J-088]MCJ2065813.1 hypothetical protein [Methylobacterium sp. J-088]